MIYTIGSIIIVTLCWIGFLSICIWYYLEETYEIVYLTDNKDTRTIWEVKVNKMGRIRHMETSKDFNWNLKLISSSETYSQLVVRYNLKRVCKKRAYDILAQNKVVKELLA